MGNSNVWGSDLPEQEDHEDDRQPSPVEQVFRNNGDLPQDILDVWAGNQNAALFIQEWGLETFRASKLHQMAVLEHERQEKLGPLRSAYLKNGTPKKHK